MKIKREDVPVTDVGITIGPILVESFKEGWFQFLNTGGGSGDDIDVVNIIGKPHEDALDTLIVESADGDFDDLPDIAFPLSSGGSANMFMSISGFWSVSFFIQCAAGEDTTVSVYVLCN